MIVRIKLADLAGRSTLAVQRMLIERGLDWRTAKAWEDKAAGEVVYEGAEIKTSSAP